MTKSNKSRSSEIKYLTAISDKDINTQDISETPDWHGAEIGKFYRPIKKSVTLRLDADVLAWLRSKHEKYQTEVNNILRKYMQTHR